MDDLISRQAAIDAIWDGINMDIYTREVKEILEELPTAEPSGELIRCKDCKYSSHCYSEVHMLDKIRSTSICKDISFCSFAERGSDG